MKKSKVILSAIGGVIGVAVLVMGYLVWTAYSAKTVAIEGDDEGTDGLETVVDNASKLSRKAVYPCAASVAAVSSNEAVVANWKDEAFKLAARGDWPVKATTPAQFKTDMVAEAKRLVGLPGIVQGKLAKPDFTFGPFKDYIAEGKMPAESMLAELQRQWGDVVLIIDTLAKCGIAELVDIQVKTKSEEGDQSANGRKAAKKKTTKGDKAESSINPSAQKYVFTFTTKPNGFIKSLNALETNERFIVVEGFSFAREKDVLAEALSGDDKKDKMAQPQETGRRRRRSVSVLKEEKEEKPKNGIITDPLLDAPFKVELTVATYDFKTLVETPKEEKK